MTAWRKTYGDAATIGKYDGFESLEADWRRQQGETFWDQDYQDMWRIVKRKGVKFAMVCWTPIISEAPERFRVKIGKKLLLTGGSSENIGYMDETPA